MTEERKKELRELGWQTGRAIGYSIPVDATCADAALCAYEVMREQGWRMIARSPSLRYARSQWNVELVFQSVHIGLHSCEERSDTFAEALCRAIVAAQKMAAADTVAPVGT